MRDLKFRCWDKKNKEWLLGYKLLGGFSLTGECVILGEFALLFRPLQRLKDIEITQYTGKKDKNDKDIYEGDIVEVDDGDNWVVGNGEIVFEGGCFLIKDENTLDEIGDSRIIKVIGTIYENKELLK